MCEIKHQVLTSNPNRAREFLLIRAYIKHLSKEVDKQVALAVAPLCEVNEMRKTAEVLGWNLNDALRLANGDLSATEIREASEILDRYMGAKIAGHASGACLDG